MSNFQPFIITHLDTATQLPVEDVVHFANQNNYLVLWWKHYPICHLFIYEDNDYTSESLLDNLFEEMKPTLEFYASRQNIPVDNAIRHAWLYQEQDKWNFFAARVFQSLPAGAFTAQDVSVVICTRNRSAYLQECLQRLQGQTHPPAEIIVVDNAPTDDATSKVVASFANVQYCLESRPGLDFARNAGARAANGKIIAYTDDDAILHPLWTQYIAAAFEQEKIMAVTGLIFAAEIATNAQLIFESFWTFNRGYLYRDFDEAWFKQLVQEGAPAWEVGAGASMAFRRELFERIGYFDERLDVGAAGCSGDSEYWYRVLAEGYTIRYTPMAVAYHFHRKNMEGLKKQIYYYMRGFTAALYIQHERYGHKGNFRHLYRKVLPWYARIFPRALRSRFSYNHSTYFQELKGIASGLLFYYRNRHPVKSQKPTS